MVRFRPCTICRSTNNDCRIDYVHEERLQENTEFANECAECVQEKEIVLEPSVTIVVDDSKTDTNPKPDLIGEFTVTAYCSCEICCGEWSNPEAPTTASGTIANSSRTVGADWNVIPEGTEIYIEGIGKRTIEDKPANWIIEKYDGMILDLYFDSHEDALLFGKRTAKVWKGV